MFNAFRSSNGAPNPPRLSPVDREVCHDGSRLFGKRAESEAMRLENFTFFNSIVLGRQPSANEEKEAKEPTALVEFKTKKRLKRRKKSMQRQEAKVFARLSSSVGKGGISMTSDGKNDHGEPSLPSEGRKNTPSTVSPLLGFASLSPRSFSVQEPPSATGDRQRRFLSLLVEDGIVRGGGGGIPGKGGEKGRGTTSLSTSTALPSIHRSSPAMGTRQESRRGTASSKRSKENDVTLAVTVNGHLFSHMLEEEKKKKRKVQEEEEKKDEEEKRRALGNDLYSPSEVSKQSAGTGTPRSIAWSRGLRRVRSREARLGKVTNSSTLLEGVAGEEGEKKTKATKKEEEEEEEAEEKKGGGTHARIKPHHHDGNDDEEEEDGKTEGEEEGGDVHTKAVPMELTLRALTTHNAFQKSKAMAPLATTGSPKTTNPISPTNGVPPPLGLHTLGVSSSSATQLGGGESKGNAFVAEWLSTTIKVAPIPSSVATPTAFSSEVPKWNLILAASPNGSSPHSTKAPSLVASLPMLPSLSILPAGVAERNPESGEEEEEEEEEKKGLRKQRTGSIPPSSMDVPTTWDMMKLLLRKPKSEQGGSPIAEKEHALSHTSDTGAPQGSGSLFTSPLSTRPLIAESIFSVVVDQETVATHGQPVKDEGPRRGMATEEEEEEKKKREEHEAKTAQPTLLTAGDRASSPAPYALSPPSPCQHPGCRLWQSGSSPSRAAPSSLLPRGLQEKRHADHARDKSQEETPPKRSEGEEHRRPPLSLSSMPFQATPLLRISTSALHAKKNLLARPAPPPPLVPSLPPLSCHLLEQSQYSSNGEEEAHTADEEETGPRKEGGSQKKMKKILPTKEGKGGKGNPEKGGRGGRGGSFLLTTTRPRLAFSPKEFSLKEEEEKKRNGGSGRTPRREEPCVSVSAIYELLHQKPRGERQRPPPARSLSPHHAPGMSSSRLPPRLSSSFPSLFSSSALSVEASGGCSARPPASVVSSTGPIVAPIRSSARPPAVSSLTSGQGGGGGEGGVQKPTAPVRGSSRHESSQRSTYHPISCTFPVGRSSLTSSAWFLLPATASHGNGGRSRSSGSLLLLPSNSKLHNDGGDGGGGGEQKEGIDLRHPHSTSGGGGVSSHSMPLSPHAAKQKDVQNSATWEQTISQLVKEAPLSPSSLSVSAVKPFEKEGDRSGREGWVVDGHRSVLESTRKEGGTTTPRSGSTSALASLPSVPWCATFSALNPNAVKRSRWVGNSPSKHLSSPTACAEGVNHEILCAMTVVHRSFDHPSSTLLDEYTPPHPFPIPPPSPSLGMSSMIPLSPKRSSPTWSSSTPHLESREVFPPTTTLPTAALLTKPVVSLLFSPTSTIPPPPPPPSASGEGSSPLHPGDTGGDVAHERSTASGQGTRPRPPPLRLVESFSNFSSSSFTSSTISSTLRKRMERGEGGGSAGRRGGGMGLTESGHAFSTGDGKGGAGWASSNTTLSLGKEYGETRPFRPFSPQTLQELRQEDEAAEAEEAQPGETKGHRTTSAEGAVPREEVPDGAARLVASESSHSTPRSSPRVAAPTRPSKTAPILTAAASSSGKEQQEEEKHQTLPRVISFVVPPQPPSPHLEVLPPSREHKDLEEDDDVETAPPTVEAPVWELFRARMQEVLREQHQPSPLSPSHDENAAPGGGKEETVPVSLPSPADGPSTLTPRPPVDRIPPLPFHSSHQKIIPQRPPSLLPFRALPLSHFDGMHSPHHDEDHKEDHEEDESGRLVRVELPSSSLGAPHSHKKNSPSSHSRRIPLPSSIPPGGKKRRRTITTQEEKKKKKSSCSVFSPDEAQPYGKASFSAVPSLPLPCSRSTSLASFPAPLLPSPSRPAGGAHTTAMCLYVPPSPSTSIVSGTVFATSASPSQRSPPQRISAMGFTRSLPPLLEKEETEEECQFSFLPPTDRNITLSAILSCHRTQTARRPVGFLEKQVRAWVKSAGQHEEEEAKRTPRKRRGGGGGGENNKNGVQILSTKGNGHNTPRVVKPSSHSTCIPLRSPYMV